MKAKKRVSPKPRRFNARSGGVLRIWVNVTKARNGSHRVRTQDQFVKVKGGLVLIVWRLRRSARNWKFRSAGVSFAKSARGQFVHPHRFNSGREFALINRNTKGGKYKYTVTLESRRSDPKEVIREDPIIENEGDGKP